MTMMPWTMLLACAGLFGFPESDHALEVLRNAFVKLKFGLFEANKIPDPGHICLYDPQPSQHRFYLCQDGKKIMSRVEEVDRICLLFPCMQTSPCITMHIHPIQVVSHLKDDFFKCWKARDLDDALLKVCWV